MKKKLLALILATGALTSAQAEITIKVEQALLQPSYTVQAAYISDLVKPRMERPAPVEMDVAVKEGTITIANLPDGAARYLIPVGDQEYLIVYAAPGDNVTMTLDGVSPVKYTADGTPLMADIAAMDARAAKIIEDYRALMTSSTPGDFSPADFEKRYTAVFNDYLAANPAADAAPYAMMQLEGEDFLSRYDEIAAKASGSPIAPLMENQKLYVERKLAADKRKAELDSGQAIAPDFTFKNAEGKEVSLSDFRGKWVIIDFWGTWCPWCIKGFPELKQAYKDYAGKLEIVGVACNDRYEAWLNGLKKYELPWVNLYNPEEGGGKLLENYAVEGFPTKVIVTPEGKIANITSGHVPEFFETLKNLIK